MFLVNESIEFILKNHTTFIYFDDNLSFRTITKMKIDFFKKNR